MARRWTQKEETKFYKELHRLYIIQNKTIREIGKELSISEQGVYDRLIRLKIKTQRHKKQGFNNQKGHVTIPKKSQELAEFIGILLGDGHISYFQTIVTLGNKEEAYVRYVAALMERLFHIQPKVLLRKSGHWQVYFGSVVITRWLYKQGLVSHKVKSQVGVPKWIFENRRFVSACLRGFFDTDGSVYKLKFGTQLSFSNRSRRLLGDLRMMLKLLKYTPSEVSSACFYLTRNSEIRRFFKDIAPANVKHQMRFREFMRRSDSGYSRRL